MAGVMKSRRLRMGVFGDQTGEVCLIIGVEEGASPTSAVGTMSENLGQVLRKVVGASSGTHV